MRGMVSDHKWCSGLPKQHFHPFTINTIHPLFVYIVAYNEALIPLLLCVCSYIVASTAGLEMAIQVQSNFTLDPQLSAQYLLDCVPVWALGDQSNVAANNPTKSGGCNGGDPRWVFESIIQEGGLVPLTSTHPWTAIQGKCRCGLVWACVGKCRCGHVWANACVGTHTRAYLMLIS